MRNETYCPCCASDYTEHQETNHTDGKLIETFKCKYCQSTFNNEYDLTKTKVVEDHSEAMYILKAKEVLETELKALGDNITNSRGFADGRVYMLLDMLVDELNDWDSDKLADIYLSSSFHATYDKTTESDLENNQNKMHTFFGHLEKSGSNKV